MYIQNKIIPAANITLINIDKNSIFFYLIHLQATFTTTVAILINFLNTIQYNKTHNTAKENKNIPVYEVILTDTYIIIPLNRAIIHVAHLTIKSVNAIINNTNTNAIMTVITMTNTHCTISSVKKLKLFG